MRVLIINLGSSHPPIRVGFTMTKWDLASTHALCACDVTDCGRSSSTCLVIFSSLSHREPSDVLVGERKRVWRPKQVCKVSLTGEHILQNISVFALLILLLMWQAGSVCESPAIDVFCLSSFCVFILKTILYCRHFCSLADDFKSHSQPPLAPGFEHLAVTLTDESNSIISAKSSEFQIGQNNSSLIFIIYHCSTYLTFYQYGGGTSLFSSGSTGSFY